MTSITTSNRAGSASTIRTSLTLDDLDFWMMLRRKHSRHTYIPSPLTPIRSLRSMTAPLMWGSPLSSRFLLDVQNLLPQKPILKTVSHPRGALSLSLSPSPSRDIALIPTFKKSIAMKTKSDNLSSGHGSGIAAFYHLLDFSVPLYRRPRPIKTPTFAWPSNHARAEVTPTPQAVLTESPRQATAPAPIISASPIITTVQPSPIVSVSVPVSPNILVCTLRTPTIPTPTPPTSTPTPTLMAGRNPHPRSKISSFFTSVTSKVSAALRLSAKR